MLMKPASTHDFQKPKLWNKRDLHYSDEEQLQRVLPWKSSVVKYRFALRSAQEQECGHLDPAVAREK